MKRTLILIAAGVTAAAVTAAPIAHDLWPTPADLYDLDHYKYYTWGIDLDVTGESIVEASLTFHDIRNWDSNANVLYVSLLDQAPPGVTVGTDRQRGGDHFDDLGLNLVTYRNLPTKPQTLVYEFDERELGALSRAVADGNFGLGFDPDCHFWNNGVQLHIGAEPVPEPSTLSLIGSGLVCAVAISRRMTR